MSRSRGRYYSKRDVRLMNSLAGELMLDIVEQIIILFKVDSDKTNENVYGESINKFYYPGIETSCFVDSDPETTNYEGFGPDVKKGVIFRFHQKLCEIKEFYPENGDIIFWENSYFEISAIVENQFLGGQPEKNFSLLCNAHLSRLSKLNISDRTL
jgi:hypothetical protein